MVFEKLKTIIAEVLNVDPDEITMDTTFMDDLGADISYLQSHLQWRHLLILTLLKEIILI